jgi:hypothetical protein
VKSLRLEVVVIGGAVLYELKPDSITSKIMPITIEIQSFLKWDEELYRKKTQTINNAEK